MGIQLTFLGGSTGSTITAQTVEVQAISFDSSAVASIAFTNTGQQVTKRNGSASVVGNWLSPPYSASEWEIKAIVGGGPDPTGSALNTWLPLSTTREWTVTDNAADGTPVQSFLTFEFRKVGGSSAEASISDNILSAESLSLFG